MKQDVSLYFSSAKSAVSSASFDKIERSLTNKFLCKWNRCKEIFDNNNDLIKHLETRHFTQIPSIGSRTLACRWDGCRIFGQTFTKATHLHRHVLQYHGGPKPYICPHSGCGKAYGKESALAIHAASHSRVSSPITVTSIQKLSETPQKQRQLLHYRRITPPMLHQTDPVDAPTLLAITEWLSEGCCRSRNPARFLKRQPKRKTESVPTVVIATRLTKSGREVLQASAKTFFQSCWIPVSDVDQAYSCPFLTSSPPFTAPSTMVSLLSTVRASAETEQQ